MKHTKLFASLLGAVVLVLSASAFAACGERGTAEAKVVESSEKLLVIEAKKTGGSLEDALQALQAAGELTYEGSQTEFGLSLETINGYTVNAAANEYWAQYTSLAELDGVSYSSTEYGSYTYGDKLLGYSSYGLTGMPLVEGEIYVFVVESW